MSILVIDNVDSFTYNLVELIHEATGESPTVLRNDVEPATVDFSRYRLVVLSPGPGTPDEPADLGASRAILDLASVPVLGVCLGH